jgi:large subunit ribosomal protein L29
METMKVREFGDAELKDEARKAAEKLFRIRFQMKLGQTEGVKNLREVRKDVARIKTIERERTLGIRGATPLAAGTAPSKTKKVRKAKAGAKESS